MENGVFVITLGDVAGLALLSVMFVSLIVYGSYRIILYLMGKRDL